MGLMGVVPESAVHFTSVWCLTLNVFFYDSGPVLFHPKSQTAEVM